MSLVDTLSEPFKPARLHDEYREAVLTAIRAKAKGKDIELPDDEPEETGDDLLATLKASLDKPKPERAKQRTSSRKKAKA